MNDKVYIHYGSNKFDVKKFVPMTANECDNSGNSFLNKPPHGTCIWASPVDTHFGWKEWCENEEYAMDKLNTSFTFTLKPNARILLVKLCSDVDKYLTNLPDLPYKSYSFRPEALLMFKYVDFVKMAKDYDGMELCHDDNYGDLHYGLFYSWDCDSIVIWNPYIIVS